MPSGASVGLRELRHHTRQVLDRVRRGETIEVTDYGRLVARLVPVEPREDSPILTRLREAGRFVPASRPGHRPRPAAGDGTDRLSAALAEDRAEVGP